MDAKLDNLIEKLKEEGVEGARKAADEILAAARQEAEEKRATARDAAAESAKEAEERAAQFQTSAERAVRQAGRDAELLLREKIDGLFQRAFRRQVAGAMGPGFLRDAILELVRTWARDGNVEARIPKDQAEGLEAILFEGVEAEVGSGITLKPSADLTGGFHIRREGEDIYYDFSDEAISELLRSFLNDRINKILAGDDG